MTKEVFLKRYDQITKNYLMASQKTKEHYITMMWATEEQYRDLEKVSWKYWLKMKQAFERARAVLVEKYTNSHN